MIKQGFQKLVQGINRIRQATTKGTILAYLLFTFVLGILAGIGLSVFNLLPSFITKLISAYWSFLGPIIGAVIGILGASLLIGGKRLIAYLKQNLPTRRIKIVVSALSILTILLCSIASSAVTRFSERSDYVSIPLTPYMGNLVLTDPLHNNRLGYQWIASPADNTACTFTPAGYQVIASEQHSFQSCIATRTDFSTFAFQTDMIFVRGAGGGIIFNDGETAYDVAFDELGQFILFTFNSSNQHQDTLMKYYPTGIIGYNQRITVTLVVKSDTIEVYLGSFCVTCQQPIVRRTPSHGSIGLLALIENGQPETQTEVLFENVQVWNL